MGVELLSNLVCVLLTICESTKTCLHSGCFLVHTHDIVESFKGLLQVRINFYSPVLLKSGHVSISLTGFTHSAERKNKECMSPRMKQPPATLYSPETQNPGKPCKNAFHKELA